MASSLHDTWRYDKRSRGLFGEQNSLRGSTTWALLKTLEEITLMVDTVLGRNVEDGRVRWWKEGGILARVMSGAGAGSAL